MFVPRNPLPLTSAKALDDQRYFVTRFDRNALVMKCSHSFSSQVMFHRQFENQDVVATSSKFGYHSQMPNSVVLYGRRPITLIALIPFERELPRWCVAAVSEATVTVASLCSCDFKFFPQKSDNKLLHSKKYYSKANITLSPQ